MAVYAAHLTRTLQGTPSVFQVTAQEALGSTVKPALKKLIEYLAAVYPNKCGWCERWYHELYLLFDLFLQYHYLKHYAASFSECFYGLHRVPISPSTEFSSGPRLPSALEHGSLALLVLAPYLRDKCEQLINRWREDLEDGRLGKTKSDQACKAAVKLYSIAHFVTESTRLLVLARYLTGKGEAPSLSLHLLGLTLRDAPPEEPDENTWGDFFKSVFNGQLGKCVASIKLFSEQLGRQLVYGNNGLLTSHVLQYSIIIAHVRGAVITFPMVWRVASNAVEYGAFAVQLLRWWDARAPLALATLPAPPPPQKDERDTRWRNVCPVCLQRWKVPTVLPVSGYVFCYTCISRHVRGANSCPVTRLPASERSLVRLYLDS